MVLNEDVNTKNEVSVLIFAFELLIFEATILFNTKFPPTMVAELIVLARRVLAFTKLAVNLPVLILSVLR